MRAMGNGARSVGVALTAIGVSAALVAPVWADPVDPTGKPGEAGKSDGNAESNRSGGSILPDGPEATMPPATARMSLPPLSSPRTVGALGQGNDRSYAFIRQPDGKISFKQLFTSGPFQQVNINGTTSTGPSVSTPPNSSSGVVMNSTSSNAAIRSGAGSGLTDWKPWENQGGVFTSAVSLVAPDKTPDGEVVQATYGRGTDGAIYAQHLEDGVIRTIRLGGVAASPPSATYRANTREIVITVRGTDGRLYEVVGPLSSEYSSFRPVGTAKVDSAASVTRRGTRYYYRGTDGALWYLNTARPGKPAVRVGGAISSTPTALDLRFGGEPERAIVVARGPNGNLYGYDNGTGGWTNYGGNVA